MLFFPFSFYFVTKVKKPSRQLSQQLRTKGSTFLCPLMLDKQIPTTVMPSSSSRFPGHSAMPLYRFLTLSPDIGADKNKGTHTQHITLNHSKKARLPDWFPSGSFISKQEMETGGLDPSGSTMSICGVHLGSCS